MDESLTIIFPAFDEEQKISYDIKRAAIFLESNNISGEIIVVDDGSSDKTFVISSQLKSLINTRLIVIKHETNHGKGFAVRSGVLEAKSDLILYSDVGDIVPFKNALTGLKKFKNENLDILHGSRKLTDSNISKPQGLDRKLSSWIFNKIIRVFFNIPKGITDTQCGFKLYKKDAAKDLYSKLETKGFLFEIEILLKAVYKNYKLAEFPIEWRCDRDSRINFWNTPKQVITDIFKLRKMFINSSI